MGSALLNGGPVSLVYGSIISALGNLAITFSLAEMASIDPHVGAQYRWSALFAQSHQEFWGLLQGESQQFNVFPKVIRHVKRGMGC